MDWLALIRALGLALRGLGLGAISGAIAAALLYHFAGGYLATAGLSRYETLSFGAGFGLLLGRLVDAALEWVVSPFFRWGRFYAQLLELAILTSRGVVSKEQARQVRGRLIQEHFFGSSRHALEKKSETAHAPRRRDAGP